MGEFPPNTSFIIFYLMSGLTADLLGNGLETADDQGTVGMGLAPGLGLFAKLGFVGDNEQCGGEVAIELGGERALKFEV